MHVKEACKTGGEGVGMNIHRALGNILLRGNPSLCLGTGGKVMFTPSIVSVGSVLKRETSFVRQMFAM